MISRSLILQILQAAKIMRRFFYEAPAEIMRIYTTLRFFQNLPLNITITSEFKKGVIFLALLYKQNLHSKMYYLHS